MKSITRAIHNEDGTVMVISLLIMAILTILGLSAIDTSTIEVQVTHNEQIYKKNFYKAEAAVIAAAQNLELATPAQLSNVSSVPWLINTEFNETTLQYKTSTGSWDDIQDGNGDWDDSKPIGKVISTDTEYDDARFLVLETTGFIDLTAPSNMHTYEIYGFYDSKGADRGRVLVEIGYKRRF